eukprot:TRINITY_DN10135_c0_g1_i1.p1 TRINITY_DN10135_c0_g1~~TRINITY_DN10135_c0_g1_i1.p1  ORF type:complete len:128 (-),score=25.48 TRINITY_DN10135_c0_g1_i1:88-471(-)
MFSRLNCAWLMMNRERIFTGSNETRNMVLIHKVVDQSSWSFRWIFDWIRRDVQARLDRMEARFDKIPDNPLVALRHQSKTFDCNVDFFNLTSTSFGAGKHNRFPLDECHLIYFQQAIHEIKWLIESK